MTQPLTPKVFSIDPALPFADTLAASVLQEFGHDPLTLSAVHIYLPSKRAVRNLQEAFLRLSDQQALVLPTLSPIGGIEEDEIEILGAGLGLIPAELSPPIDPEQRQILLMRQVERWLKAMGRGTISYAQSWRLAGDLGRFLDQVQTERLEFDQLLKLAGEDLAEHWQITTEFLAILTEHWPQILTELDREDPAVYRDKILSGLAALWREKPPMGPVIAAGSTGTVKGTADLLKVIAHLPNGRVVLPGLDTEMSHDYWQDLDETHPQFAMAQLLDHMGVKREDVLAMGDEETVAPYLSRRVSMLQDAMMPAGHTKDWARFQYKNQPDNDLFQHFDLLVAPGSREEADSIALMMREAIETPGKTAALITPDRVLARYVKASLARWNLQVDDSAGQPVSDSLPGTVLVLIAGVLASDFSPLALLALMQHPLVCAGGNRESFRKMTRAVDRAVFRGPRPEAGNKGLISRARKAVHDKHHPLPKEYLPLFEGFINQFAPLADAIKRPPAGATLRDILKQHLSLAEDLTANDVQSGKEALWRGEAGEALASCFEKHLVHLSLLPLHSDAGSAPLTAGDYAPFFEELMANIVIRPVWGRHPRLYIWGALEARLQRADLMILGGLNEGVWPTDIKADPWMSRPMRKEFGLPALERRIGQAAHDFMQAACAEQVVITRSEKLDGSPTVASRWLMRIEALTGRLPVNRLPYLSYAQLLDQPSKRTQISAPRPTPPVAARPKKLSVTQVETLMCDPYALYANKILGLRKWDDIDAAPNAAQRGNMIHDALERFLKEEGPTLGQAGLTRLLSIGEAVFQDFISMPTVYAFWWPRFENVAKWFVAEQETRAQSHKIRLLEKFAEMKIAPFDFTLIAKADRIDSVVDGGSYEVIDYKTGTKPTSKKMLAGFAPQLPLEGWMAEQGAFPNLPPMPVSALDFWMVKGGDPAGKVEQPAKKHLRDVIDLAESGLKSLIATYNQEETPYLSKPRPYVHTYADYDLLARVQEWQAAADPFSDGIDQEAQDG